LTGVAGVLEGELFLPGVVEAIAVVLEGVPDPFSDVGGRSLERPATESSKSCEIPNSASLEAFVEASAGVAFGYPGRCLRLVAEGML